MTIDNKKRKFGGLVKYFRENAGLTLEKFADLVRIKVSVIQDIEGGIALMDRKEFFKIALSLPGKPQRKRKMFFLIKELDRIKRIRLEKRKKAFRRKYLPNELRRKRLMQSF